MPYKGVPKSKWGKLDRCVEHVMSSSDFKKRYASRIKKIGAKSLAIAICRKTMGI